MDRKLTMPNEAQPSEIEEGFKKLFTPEEAKVFLTLQVKLVSSLEKYAAESKEDKAFRPDENREFTRDRSVQINLTILSSIISQVSKNKLDHLLSNIPSIIKALTELKNDLGVFCAFDNNTTRQKVYRDGLEYMDKIITLLPEALDLKASAHQPRLSS